MVEARKQPLVVPIRRKRSGVHRAWFSSASVSTAKSSPVPVASFHPDVCILWNSVLQPSSSTWSRLLLSFISLGPCPLASSQIY